MPRTRRTTTPAPEATPTEEEVAPEATTPAPRRTRASRAPVAAPVDAPEAEEVEVVAVARGVLSGEVAARLASEHPSGSYTPLRAEMRGDASRAERRANIVAALRQAGLAADSEGRCPLVDPTAAPKVPERRFAVLAAIADGYSNNEVAAALYMNVQTMKSHQGNLHRQFGVDTRVKLVVEAVRCGLLNPAPYEAR